MLSLLLENSITRILINQQVLILPYDWLLRSFFCECSRPESSHAEIRANVTSKFNGRRSMALFYIVALPFDSSGFLAH